MPATEHESFAHGSPDIGKLLEGQDVDAKRKNNRRMLLFEF